MYPLLEYTAVLLLSYASVEVRSTLFNIALPRTVFKEVCELFSGHADITSINRVNETLMET